MYIVSCSFDGGSHVLKSELTENQKVFMELYIKEILKENNLTHLEPSDFSVNLHRKEVDSNDFYFTYRSEKYEDELLGIFPNQIDLSEMV